MVITLMFFCFDFPAKLTFKVKVLIPSSLVAHARFSCDMIQNHIYVPINPNIMHPFSKTFPCKIGV